MAQMQSTRSEASQELDIADIIIEDHKLLKELIETLKDTDLEIEERQEAFVDFATLLVTHAKPEEETLYDFMKSDDELAEEGWEGEVEHQLADQLLEEIKRETDSNRWSAQVKVLAELVEHHIEEEEGELLPDFREHSTSEERASLADRFIELKTELLMMGGDDSPSEEDLVEEEDLLDDEDMTDAHH